jgi:hypothetical protein
MGLCFVKGVDADLGAAMIGANFSVFRFALPRTKNGIFFSSRSASGQP